MLVKMEKIVWLDNIFCSYSEGFTNGTVPVLEMAASPRAAFRPFVLEAAAVSADIRHVGRQMSHDNGDQPERQRRRFLASGDRLGHRTGWGSTRRFRR